MSGKSIAEISTKLEGLDATLKAHPIFKQLRDDIVSHENKAQADEETVNTRATYWNEQQNERQAEDELRTCAKNSFLSHLGYQLDSGQPQTDSIRNTHWDRRAQKHHRLDQAQQSARTAHWESRANIHLLENNDWEAKKTSKRQIMHANVSHEDYWNARQQRHAQEDAANPNIPPSYREDRISRHAREDEVLSATRQAALDASNAKWTETVNDYKDDMASRSALNEPTTLPQLSFNLTYYLHRPIAKTYVAGKHALQDASLYAYRTIGYAWDMTPMLLKQLLLNIWRTSGWLYDHTCFIAMDFFKIACNLFIECTWAFYDASRFAYRCSGWAKDHAQYGVYDIGTFVYRSSGALVDMAAFSALAIAFAPVDIPRLIYRTGSDLKKVSVEAFADVTTKLERGFEKLDFWAESRRQRGEKYLFSEDLLQRLQREGDESDTYRHDSANTSAYS